MQCEQGHPDRKCFLAQVLKIFRLPRFEYVNPVAGLAMVIVGLVLLTLGYALLALAPIAVGLFLVAYYRKDLLILLGV